MQNGQLNWITGFIWNIADDVLRDVYVRGKYRDVILPMVVIRRLDAVLELTKQEVLKLDKQLDDSNVANKHAPLCQASGNAFYNVSPFTLRDLRSRAKQQQLKADFVSYLDGFSPNVQEILEKFKFRNQIPTLVEADILDALYGDYNEFCHDFDLTQKKIGLKLSATDKKAILRAVSWKDEEAPPIVKTAHKPGKVETDPLYGRYEAVVNGAGVVEYEPDTDIRDTEQIPLLEQGGIEAFFEREVLPHVSDAWIDHSKTQIGYEISFTRHFYKPVPLRELDEIRADIEALQKEAEGLLEEIVAGGA